MQLFGTDGIRSSLGKEPLIIESLIRLGNAYAYWLTQKNINEIIIGADTRTSGHWIKSILKSTLLTHGITIYDAEILPTPIISYAVEKQYYRAGICITASHNTADDNGIKFFTSPHGKMNPQDEYEITNLFKNNKSNTNYNSNAQSFIITNFLEKYSDYLQTKMETNFLKNKTIVVDCANGAWSPYAEKILALSGAKIIPIYNQPSGININANCGSINPQIISEATVKYNADYGISFDGDGDRIIMCNQDGIIKDGDDILVILSQHPNYNKEQYIIGTIMSNEGLANFLKNNNKILIRTPVGDKYIIDEMNTRKAMIGGEPSGHSIISDITQTSDGMVTALRVLESITHTHNWNLDTFIKYPHAIVNIPITKKYNLEQKQFATLIQETNNKINNGRLIIRYSGTEPVLRIMIESLDHNNALQLCNTLSNKLNTIFMKDTK